MNTTATVFTLHASRYLQQLSKHWAHKFDVEFTAERSTIRLPIGAIGLEAADDRLAIILSAADVASMDELQDVLESHINRFAHREGPLVFEWAAIEPAAGQVPSATRI